MLQYYEYMSGCLDHLFVRNYSDMSSRFKINKLEKKGVLPECYYLLSSNFLPQTCFLPQLMTNGCSVFDMKSITFQFPADGFICSASPRFCSLVCTCKLVTRHAYNTIV